MFSTFKILIALLLVGNVAFADNLPTVHQIYQTAESGKLDDAHRMVEQVLQAHPDSAKAHFVDAEILAKQGSLTNAKTELETAERLAPGLPFAKPESVQAIKQRIAASQQNGLVNSAAATAQSNEKPFPWMMLMLGLGALALIGWVLKSIFSRNNSNTYPAQDNTGYGTIPGRGYPVAGGPATPSGFGAAPSYPGQTGGGIGSGIVSGLATGAAVGAGIVAGEALMHHFTDGSNSNTGNTSDVGNNHAAFDSNAAQPQYDMGGTDFGLTDNSSWDNDTTDSSSSGDDGW